MLLEQTVAPKLRVNGGDQGVPKLAGPNEESVEPRAANSGTDKEPKGSREQVGPLNQEPVELLWIP